jgi:hypothetical protein
MYDTRSVSMRAPPSSGNKSKPNLNHHDEYSMPHTMLTLQRPSFSTFQG